MKTVRGPRSWIPVALARALRIAPNNLQRLGAICRASASAARAYSTTVRRRCVVAISRRERSSADSAIVRGPASRRRSQDDLRGATPPDDAPLKNARFKIPATSTPGPGSPPQTLLGFYWHFIRQTKGWYGAMFVASLCVALLDTVIPLVIGRLVALMAASDRAAAIAASWPMLIGDGSARAVRTADRDLVRHHDSSERARARRDELDPVAEPLARRASEPHVLPERFCGPDREPGDADRRQLARECDVEHPCGLVHRRLRRHGVCADDVGRLAARRADLRLGDRLYSRAALLRAPLARACARELGRPVNGDGPRRRQLHEYPHREAVCAARAKRTPTCATRSTTIRTRWPRTPR